MHVFCFPSHAHGEICEPGIRNTKGHLYVLIVGDGVIK
jgi:hypothetical protein